MVFGNSTQRSPSAFELAPDLPSNQMPDSQLFTQRSGREARQRGGRDGQRGGREETTTGGGASSNVIKGANRG